MKMRFATRVRLQKSHSPRLLLFLPVVLVTSFFLSQAFARQAVSPPPARIRVAWKAQKPLQVSGDRPVYPPLAAQARIEGSVRLEFVVATDGSTKDISVLSGHPLLVGSALDSVRTWRFKQTIVNGVPVDVETSANVNFFLPGNSPAKFVAADREAVRKHPDDPNARKKLGRGLLAVGEVEEASAEFRQAVTLRPNDIEAHFGLGDALRANGNLDGAIAEYRQGLLLKPGETYAHFELAHLLEKKGDLEAAVVQHREGLRQTPKEGHRHHHFGILLKKKGDVDAAIEEFRLALHYGFDVPFAHFELGRALEQKGDLDGALKEYQKAAKNAPENHDMREARDRLLQGRKP
jgi:TonB family protein